MITPFAAVDLSPKLTKVEAYWRSLIRGANNLPFWDDFVPAALSEVGGDLLLLDVFAKPTRLRFDSIVGPEIERRYGEAVRDRFSDEIELRTPFEYLNAQASATLESGKPTLHRGSSYVRLLLPMWGDGRISMLLCAYDWL